jgi:TRAP-type C4-dicarboxylate transport system substrate-binding protein
MLAIRLALMPIRQFVLLVVALLCGGAAAAEEVVLRLGSAWNARQNFVVDFQRYIDAVNEKGKGLVRIEFVGGPEVIPEQQLLYALRRGVIDLAFGGMTYWRGVLPEGDAIFASSLTPAEARASGALAALQPYWGERINAHLIGWVQSSMGANLWLREAPPLDARGVPNLRGKIIRTSPSNRELLQALGARTVQIPVSEIYTALERGMVDGLAFTPIGLADLGIAPFIRYRIDPPVLKLAICIQINRDVWRRLPAGAQRLLEAEADAYEPANRARFEALQAREWALLDRDGLTRIELSPAGAEASRQLARDVVWQRFAARAPEAAARLRPLFDPAGRLR